MSVFLIMFGLMLAIGMLLLGTGAICRWVFRAWSGWSISIRLIALVLIGGFVVAPFVAFRVREHKLVLARVPTPLSVAEIEYRLEESWGAGGPGDNETGFVVYRLTDDSLRWVRSKGGTLNSFLPGGPQRWRSTPVDGAADKWHRYDNDKGMGTRRPHRTNIAEYLGKYGFSIPIEQGRDTEANEAIQNSGSFYSYGRGGSVTIVDPDRGKVYFAYAG